MAKIIDLGSLPPDSPIFNQGVTFFTTKRGAVPPLEEPEEEDPFDSLDPEVFKQGLAALLSNPMTMSDGPCIALLKQELHDLEEWTAQHEGRVMTKAEDLERQKIWNQKAPALKGTP